MKQENSKTAKPHKKSIGAITYHASHNFGSVLQAYALQNFIEHNFGANFSYEIINLRTERQKLYYQTIFQKKGLKNRIKRLIFLGHKKQFDLRAKRFEDFIASRLNLSAEEYSGNNELKNAKLSYDYYISGSDQIWNLAPCDFDWAYYLEFTKCRNKLSYAASFGQKAQNWTPSEKERVRRDLEQFSYISVREEKSADNVREVLGRKPEINIDPTLLIGQTEWGRLAKAHRLSADKYILLYDLKSNAKAYEISKRLSRQLGMPVVLLKEDYRKHLRYNFIKAYDTGPEEFLGLMKNASLIVSSSFHGVVFSIIFKKQFIAVDGDSDYRINDLLKKTKLTSNIARDIDEASLIAKNQTEDFAYAEKYIKAEQRKSLSYLREAFGEA